MEDLETRQLTLIDFGAAKDFPKAFVDDYLRMVVACAEKDKQGIVDASVALGFLTGVRGRGGDPSNHPLTSFLMPSLLDTASSLSRPANG